MPTVTGFTPETLDAIKTSLASILAAEDLVVHSAPRLTITNTSKTIVQAGGEALPARCKGLIMYREEASTEAIRFTMTGADAGATSAEWLPNGLVFRTTKTVGDVIELYAANTTYATLLVLTPRS